MSHRSFTILNSFSTSFMRFPSCLFIGVCFLFKSALHYCDTSFHQCLLRGNQQTAALHEVPLRPENPKQKLSSWSFESWVGAFISFYLEWHQSHYMTHLTTLGERDWNHRPLCFCEWNTWTNYSRNSMLLVKSCMCPDDADPATWPYLVDEVH